MCALALLMVFARFKAALWLRESLFGPTLVKPSSRCAVVVSFSSAFFSAAVNGLEGGEPVVARVGGGKPPRTGQLRARA